MHLIGFYFLEGHFSGFSLSDDFGDALGGLFFLDENFKEMPSGGFQSFMYRMDAVYYFTFDGFQIGPVSAQANFSRWVLY